MKPTIDVTELIPRELHPDLLWLGKLPPSSWLSVQPGKQPPGDTRPRTDLVVHDAALDAAPGAAQHDWMIRMLRQAGARRINTLTVAMMEAYGRCLADGPKLFCPSEEQWEAAENIEVRLPPSQFRMPYPVLVIRIPNTCRRRMYERLGVSPDRMPTMMLVRHRREPGERGFILTISRFGAEEMFHVMQDQDGNDDIESVLQREVYDGPEAEPLTRDNVRSDFPASQLMSRACLNLCLMMMHWGTVEGGPLNPIAYAKHRAKKHLRHLAPGDFLSVRMKQDITLRRGVYRPPSDAPSIGAEVAPHWVRGHWRAAPGHGAARAAGERVPLVLVRPYITRAAQVVGDLSQTEVAYNAD